MVVEDEPLVRELYLRTLSDAGFAVAGACDAAACRSIMKTQPVHLILLDLGLPGLDGMSFARELRAADRELGLLIVSRRDRAEDRVEALELGCDDYLVKPAHLGELSARAVALARRRAMRARLRFGPVLLDLDARTVEVAGQFVRLSRGEFTLLALLGEAGGRIVARGRLAEAVSRSGDDGDLRTVDALVRRIRRKLEPSVDNPIETAPGFGYRLGYPVENA